MNPVPEIDYRNATAPSPLGRFLWATLACALSLAGGFAVARLWYEPSRVPPVPAVCSYLYILTREPLPGMGQIDASAKKDGEFLSTQRILVTSPEVIAIALSSPEIARLPIIKTQADPEVWLRDQVRVELLEDTRLLRVSMSGTDPAGQAAIVNAITTSYLQWVQRWTDEENTERLSSLAEAERGFKQTIERLRNAIREATSQSKAPIDLEAMRDELAFTQEMAKPIRMAKEGLIWEAGQGARIKLIARAKPSRAR